MPQPNQAVHVNALSHQIAQTNRPVPAIRNRIATGLFLVALGLSIIAGTLVVAALVYRLPRLDALQVSYPVWVTIFPPVASFLSLIAITLHFISNRIYRMTRRRLEEAYATAGAPLLFSDLPDWLRGAQQGCALVYARAARWVAIVLAIIVGVSAVGATVIHPRSSPTFVTVTKYVQSSWTIPTPQALPNAITLGPDGNLWFAEQGSNKIGRITSSGAITEWPIAAAGITCGITAGPDGSLWFTVGGVAANQVTPVPAYVGRITPTGSITLYPIPEEGSVLCYGMVTGPDGALWFGMEGKNMAIARFTPNGTFTSYPLSANFAPLDLTVGSDGNLWFTESSFLPAPPETDIVRLTTQGVMTRFRVGSGQQAGFVTSIARGLDGDLWFDYGYTTTLGGAPEPQAVIGRVTQTGTITLFPLPSLHSGMTYGDPIGMAAGADGAMWFGISISIGSSSQPTNYIGRITPNGSVHLIALNAGGVVDLAAGSGRQSLWYVGASNTIGVLRIVVSHVAVHKG